MDDGNISKWKNANFHEYKVKKWLSVNVLYETIYFLFFEQFFRVYE